MGVTSNEAKRHWNAAHYTQVKVSITTELAAKFKAMCLAEGVSMASEISRFMSENTSGLRSAKPLASPYATRTQRRKELSQLIIKLGAIMDAEQPYLDNIPDNLKNSRFYDAAVLSVSVFEEALNILADAY